jgi:hypothetical protein
MKYDLVIRDGEVIDPGSSLRGHMDIAISGGKIVTGKRRLIPHLTPKDGRVVYERPARIGAGIRLPAAGFWCSEPFAGPRSPRHLGAKIGAYAVR